MPSASLVEVKVDMGLWLSLGLRLGLIKFMLNKSAEKTFG